MTWIASLLIAAIAHQAQADRVSSTHLGLCAKAALQVSPKVASAKARAEASRLSAELANPSPYPVLGLSGRLWALSTSSPGESLSNSEDPSLRYRFTTQLRLPLLRIAASRDTAGTVSATEVRGQADQLVTRQRLFAELALTYATSRAATEVLPAQEALTAFLRRSVDVMRLRRQAGLALPAELLRMEEALSASLDGEAEAHLAVDVSRSKLAQLSGLPLGRDTPQLLPLPEVLVGSAEEAAARARAQRAEVISLRAQTAEHRARAQSVWQNAAELDFGVGYTHGSRGLSLDELNGITALLEFRAPLDAARRALLARDRELAEARAAELAARALGNEVAAEAQGAFLAYRQAQSKVRQAEGELAAARADFAVLSARRDTTTAGGDKSAEMPRLLVSEEAERKAEVRLALARGQAELMKAQLLAALGENLVVLGPGPTPAPAKPSKVPAGAEVPTKTVQVRGLWVWHTVNLLTENEPGADLLRFCKEQQLNQVYLSFPAGVGKDPRLARLVLSLKEAGIQVEALIGEATWYLPAHRQRLFARMEEVRQFNLANKDAAFAGIHLDIEPHQLPQNKGPSNLAFVPLLTDTLRQAGEKARSFGLPIAVDLPRKVLSAPPKMKTELFSASQRVFLMLYEMKPDEGKSYAQTASEKAALGLEENPSVPVVLGVRPRDTGLANLEDLRSSLIRAVLSRGNNQVGFALHDYTALR